MQGSILSSSETFLTVFLAHYFYKNDRLDWRENDRNPCWDLAGIMMTNWGQDFQFAFQWKWGGLHDPIRTSWGFRNYSS